MLTTILPFLLCVQANCNAFSLQMDVLDDIQIGAKLEVLDHKPDKKNFNPSLTVGYYGQSKTDSDNDSCCNKMEILQNSILKLERMFDAQQKNIDHLKYIISEKTNDKLNHEGSFDVPETDKVYEKRKTENTMRVNGVLKKKHHNYNRENAESQNEERLIIPVSTTYSSINNVNIIAFYAYMSSSTHSITIQHPLVFDVVKTNIGNGYHASTGVFIAPETGVYVFTWIIREYDVSHHSTQLMVNNDEIGIIRVHPTNYADIEGTGIVVTHVNAGDDVFVRTHESWNSGVINSDPGGRSSFAGWKLS